MGIEYAYGEFITFVDADDTIDENMLEKMYKEAIAKQADVVVCDYDEIMEKETIRKKAIPQKTEDLKKDYIVSVAGPCKLVPKWRFSGATLVSVHW